MDKKVIRIGKLKVQKEDVIFNVFNLTSVLISAFIIILVVYFFYIKDVELKGRNSEELDLFNVSKWSFFGNESSNESGSIDINSTEVNNFSQGSNQDINRSGNESFDDYINSTEVHWDHMPLKYRIDKKEDCEGNPLLKMNEALDVISKKSGGNVSFIEVNSEEDIMINCVDDVALLNNSSISCANKSFDYDKKFIDVVREGLIKEEDYLVNLTEISRNITTNSSETIYEICHISSNSENIKYFKESKPVIENGLILSHSINIYKSRSGWSACADFPSREVHELLHGFGFLHSEEPDYDTYYGWSSIDPLKDIMFSTLLCKYQRKFDDKYSSCLKKIYGEEGDCDEALIMKIS